MARGISYSVRKCLSLLDTRLIKGRVVNTALGCSYSTTKSPLDGGLFWRSDSELCAAVIALELRSCRLAEQPEHETPECLLRQGYLFDIGRAADRAVGGVVFVFDGDGGGVRRSDRSCVRRRVCGVSDIFPVGFGDVVRIGHKNALDSVGEVFLDGFDSFLDGLSTLFEAEKVLVHGDFVGSHAKLAS